MSCSRIAAKTFVAVGQRGGHLGLERRLLQVAEALELAEAGQGGQVDRAGDLVDVAVVEVERRGGLELGEEAVVGAVGDLQPDRRPPLPLAEGLLDRREQAALDLGLLDRQVAVAGDAEGRRARRPGSRRRGRRAGGRSRPPGARTGAGRRSRRAAAPGG